jgi:hypothetical protein
MHKIIRQVRRIVSVILLLIGGYFLLCEASGAWIDPRDGGNLHFFLLVFYLQFAVVPLALGTWVNPSNRLADLGLTSMIAASVGTIWVFVILPALSHPSIAEMIWPGQQLPRITLSPVMGTLNLLLFAGGGYALWRRGKTRDRQQKPDLETVFGD